MSEQERANADRQQLWPINFINDFFIDTCTDFRDLNYSNDQKTFYSRYFYSKTKNWSDIEISDFK